MAGRDKHRQRSQRSYINSRQGFASYARSTVHKNTQKQQRKSFFEGLKSAFTKMFKKSKEG